MTVTTFDPTLDLAIERVIHAPRQEVWRAWTDPALLEQWWIPAPMVSRVIRLDPQPGGAFVTSMSEDGQNFDTHTDCIFLVVEDGRRLVFTNAIDSAWRPAWPEPVSMTAEILFDDHPDGTRYRAIVRHGDPAHRDRHAELGFYDGWSAVTEQLAQLVESGTTSSD